MKREDSEVGKAVRGNKYGTEVHGKRNLRDLLLDKSCTQRVQ